MKKTIGLTAIAALISHGAAVASPLTVRQHGSVMRIVAMKDRAAMTFLLTDGGIYEERDNGYWSLINDGLPWRGKNDRVIPPFATDLLQVTANPEQLYLATDSGLYESKNRGRKWEPVALANGATVTVSDDNRDLNSDLCTIANSPVAISRLAFSPDESLVYAATRYGLFAYSRAKSCWSTVKELGIPRELGGVMLIKRNASSAQSQDALVIHSGNEVAIATDSLRFHRLPPLFGAQIRSLSYNEASDSLISATQDGIYRFKLGGSSSSASWQRLGSTEFANGAWAIEAKREIFAANLASISTLDSQDSWQDDQQPYDTMISSLAYIPAANGTVRRMAGTFDGNILLYDKTKSSWSDISQNLPPQQSVTASTSQVLQLRGLQNVRVPDPDCDPGAPNSDETVISLALTVTAKAWAPPVQVAIGLVQATRSLVNWLWKGFSRTSDWVPWGQSGYAACNVACIVIPQDEAVVDTQFDIRETGMSVWTQVAPQEERVRFEQFGWSRWDNKAAMKTTNVGGVNYNAICHRFRSWSPGKSYDARFTYWHQPKP